MLGLIRYFQIIVSVAQPPAEPGFDPLVFQEETTRMYCNTTEPPFKRGAPLQIASLTLMHIQGSVQRHTAIAMPAIRSLQALTTSQCTLILEGISIAITC